MKLRIFLFFVLLMLPFGWASCSADEPELPLHTEQPAIPEDPDGNDENNNDNDVMTDRLNIRIGSTSFSLTLKDNVAANAFKALLPLTLNMSELNGNEKYFNLTTNLPTAVSHPGTIRTGDLMVFGSSTLVLFYETFTSSYSYTPLGQVDNPMGLAATLGRGSVTVTIEKSNN